ncbi:SatD family protein [Clostridium sp. C2-6-12]|uniref:SatD family protein n=1 Tax=Clostridium sp. C2-6-12 TaxID=2698832 RepID=UPI00136AA282|nr:SatD family protein [Clostridium sp. C2-6-12]
MFFFFFKDSYIAIIGDIKNSKKLSDRNIVQNDLKNLLNNINEKYSKDISSKFTITLGDEFQGLLHDGSNVMNIIEEIQRDIYPVEIRFGIGVGQISTEINLDMAIGADGPGYYKAREGIEYLKKNERKNKTHSSDIRIEIDGDNGEASMMINTILSLLAVIKCSWTDRQREIIWDIMKHNDSQAKCAERLKVAQSTIQRSLINGNYYAYKEAMDTIGNVLKEIKKDV